ncbi:MAG: hypothetical protein WD766_00400 [Gemmatimonadota bacterium]
MRTPGIRLLPILLAFLPADLAAQLPIPLAIEARVGIAAPQGEFSGTETSFGAEAGPTLGIGLRLDLVPQLGIFGGYQQTNFGCDRCAGLLLDDSAVLKGLEAGVQLSLPLAAAGVIPWIRGSVMQQTLGFSGQGETLTSEAAIGYNAGAGLTARFAERFEISPGVRFISAPADFDFTTLPDRHIDVAAFAIDFALAVRL